MSPKSRYSSPSSARSATSCCDRASPSLLCKKIGRPVSPPVNAPLSVQGLGSPTTRSGSWYVRRTEMLGGDSRKSYGRSPVVSLENTRSEPGLKVGMASGRSGSCHCDDAVSALNNTASTVADHE